MQTVRCKVTGHSNGPPCPACKKPMDSIQVVDEKTKNINGEHGHYCWPCSRGN